MASIVYFVDKDRIEVELTQRDTTIGRDKECGIRLDHDLEVSRLHCTVQQQEDESYLLIDENARNGTFLNGDAVLNEGRELSDGDQIRVGKTILRFFAGNEDDEEQAGGRTEMIFAEVEHELEEGKGFKTLMGEITGRPKDHEGKT